MMFSVLCIDRFLSSVDDTDVERLVYLLQSGARSEEGESGRGVDGGITYA